MPELTRLLKNIESLMPENILKTFNPPATDEMLAGLEVLTVDGLTLTDDIRTLLRWRNGQKWNSPLSVNSNYRFLSAEEIAETLKFYNDPDEDFLRPWNASWFPVLTSDSSNYLVLETSGEDCGKLIRYWHDYEDRSVYCSGLVTFIRELVDEYADIRSGR
jgi:hypothetical protein